MKQPNLNNFKNFKDLLSKVAKLVDPKIKEVLKAALIRGESRWDDSQYFTRIIFCDMIKDDVMGSIGYGISSIEHDNGREILHVYPDKQEVIIGEEIISFENFIK